MQLNIDYNVVTAVAAVVAAVTAVFAVWVEGRRGRFLHGLETLLKLTDEFNGDRLKRARASAVQLVFPTPEPVVLMRAAQETSIGQIIDHFQIVGLLLRRKILDRELVYSEYFFWLQHYFYFFEAFISESRRPDSTVWEDAYWLHENLMVLERKYRGRRANVLPTVETVRDFILEESSD
jgi:hypothetical protein